MLRPSTTTFTLGRHRAASVAAARARGLLLLSALTALAILPGLPTPVGPARAVAQVAPGSLTPDSAAGVLRAVRIDGSEGPVVLDGRLAEPVWQRAPAADDFRQQEPDEGASPTEATEVRVAYDDEALYVAVLARDSDPEGIVGRVLQRDRVMESGFRGLDWAGDDGVAILLDPFHDHRNAVVLATNPNGAEFDALLTDEGRETNVSWRGIWEVASSRTPEGWSAEFRIPFRSLRYPDADGEQPWGFNVFRTISRRNELILWRSWSRDNEGFRRVSRAGHLVGLDDLPRPGLNLQVKPYALAASRQVRRDDGALPTSGDVDVGLDVKSEVRPGLVLDLTLNTDFAQVEVDDEQVNLTRFDLFFPEKRDFFLENAGIFEFGVRGFGGPPPLLLFFSRQIGIGPEGPVPILGGARLTGRAGEQTVGLLNVVTGGDGAVPRENFAVARVQRDLGDRDYVGFMFTDRRRVGALPEDAGAGTGAESAFPANTVAGVDGAWWLSNRLQLQGLLVRSATEGPGGEGTAWRGALDYTADRWGWLVQHLTIGPGLRTRSGFTLRTDLRQTQANFRVSPRPDFGGLRRVDFRASGLYQSRVDGRFQDWSAGLTALPQWNRGDDASVGYTAGETRVDETFLLAGRAPIPAGRYDAGSLSWRIGTTEARPWSLSHSGSREDLFGGRLWSFAAGVRVAPDPRVEAGLDLRRNDVSVPSDDFVANIASLRLAWAASTRVTTNLLLQYNSLEDAVSTNLRFNFIHRPGSDLFVVLTEGRGEEDDLFRVRDRGLVVKLTWLERF